MRPNDAVAEPEPIAEVDSATDTDPSPETAVVRIEGGIRFGGVVVDEVGRPVAGARVSVWPANKSYFSRRFVRLAAPTGADGRFAVASLAPGAWLAEAAHGESDDPTFTATKETLRFESATDDARLLLVRWGWFAFGAVRPDHATVTHGSLVASGSALHMPLMVAAGEGRFLVGPFEAGKHAGSLVFEGCAPVRREFEARWSETIDLGQLVLDPGIAWDARVVDLDGAAIVGAEIALDGDDVAALTSDADGRFRFAHRPRSRAIATVKAARFIETVRPLDFELSNGPDRIVLRHGSVLTGRIPEVSGDASADTQILGQRLGPIVLDACPNSWSTKFDPLGGFELRLAPGRWRVSFVDTARRETRIGEWVVTEGESTDVGALPLPK